VWCAFQQTVKILRVTFPQAGGVALHVKVKHEKNFNRRRPRRAI